MDILIHSKKFDFFFTDQKQSSFEVICFLFAAVDCDDIEVVIALTYSDIVYTQISILYGCLFFSAYWSYLEGIPDYQTYLVL